MTMDDDDDDDDVQPKFDASFSFISMDSKLKFQLLIIARPDGSNKQ
jgi:hypothetical protein